MTLTMNNIDLEYSLEDCLPPNFFFSSGFNKCFTFFQDPKKLLWRQNSFHSTLSAIKYLQKSSIKYYQQWNIYRNQVSGIISNQVFKEIKCQVLSAIKYLVFSFFNQTTKSALTQTWMFLLRKEMRRAQEYHQGHRTPFQQAFNADG